MQSIAAWTNLSETTFVCEPTDQLADYRLRIFTPRRELPFAGHPTIGSAHAVLRRGFKPRTAGRLVQECGKGLVDIKIDGERLFLALPEPEFREPTKSHLAAVADSLCVSGADVQRAAIIDVGPVWFTVQLVSGDAIGLLGSRCRCNHSGAQDPGELQGKHRYAPGALCQDRIPGGDSTIGPTHEEVETELGYGVVDPRRRQARAVDGSPLSGKELSRERCRIVKDARSIFDRGFELAAFVPLVP